MTINDAFKKTIEKLKSKNFIENPVLEARILICHVLKINEKEFIIIKDKKEVSDSEWGKIKKLINKRLNKDTIACIVNNKYFYDSEFYVNKNVLTPRPETELLIDIIKTKNKKDDIIDILDIGTGTGNIAISCAKYFKNSIIEALDISKKAVNIAKININKNSIDKNQIKIFQKNIFKFIPKKKYDIIVSNPPYIKTKNAVKLIREKTICDPLLALNGGKDGLKYYRRLLVIADNCLKNNGAMYLEHGMEQRLEILSIFDKEKFLIKTYDDLSGIDRVVEVRLRS